MVHHFYLFFLAALQGVTELFPISSLGHSILVPAIFRWPINRDASWFLPFIVVLHLGTLAALLSFFWRDWVSLLGAFLRDRGRPRSAETRLLWLLVLASIPAGLLGLALAHRIKDLFGGFSFAAVALMVNGILLIWGDRLRAREPSHNLEKLSWQRALVIGFAVSGADSGLFPLWRNPRCRYWRRARLRQFSALFLLAGNPNHRRCWPTRSP